jgi:A/G-specific adenine glycosylase
VSSARKLAPLEHGFTHFTLRAQPMLCAVQERSAHAQAAGRMWLDTADAVHAAVPAPVRAVLKSLAMP